MKVPLEVGLIVLGFVVPGRENRKELAGVSRKGGFLEQGEGQLPLRQNVDRDFRPFLSL